MHIGYKFGLVPHVICTHKFLLNRPGLPFECVDWKDDGYAKEF